MVLCVKVLRKRKACVLHICSLIDFFFSLLDCIDDVEKVAAEEAEHEGRDEKTKSHLELWILDLFVGCALNNANSSKEG